MYLLWRKRKLRLCKRYSPVPRMYKRNKRIIDHVRNILNCMFLFLERRLSIKTKCMSNRAIKALSEDVEIVHSTISSYSDIEDCSREDMIRMIYLEVGNINEVLEGIIASGYNK